jgi:ribosomal protein L11 methyltransferase
MLEGLPPNNATHMMRVRCPDAVTAQRVADIIVETFDPAETAASAFEESSAKPEVEGPWIVEAYFGAVPDEAQVRDLIGIAADADLAAQAQFGRVQKADWVAASLGNLLAVRAGRFLLHGEHDRQAARINDLAIEIEAALAFGTGHHGTTHGCLMFLDRLRKRGGVQHCLDIGTGTGVLAIAAAKAFHKPVVAGDIDPVAVATAKTNARRNGVGAFIRIVEARGIDHPALRGRYNLITANILAAPLRRLAPALAKSLAPGGNIILSGLLGRDVPGIVSAYRAQNLRLVARLDIDGWATLLMRRLSLRGASASKQSSTNPSS